MTGLGMVTPAGCDRESTWSAIRAGRTSAAPDPALAGLPITLSCRVPDLVGDRPILHGAGSAYLDPVARFALAAVAEALEHAGLGPQSWDGGRVAVVVGSGLGGLTTQDTALASLAEGGAGSVSPYFHPGYLINMAGAQIALRLHITGPGLTVSTACASGATAIGVARDLLAAGSCDLALACGAEAGISRLTVAGFTQLGALSPRGSRPFDTDRDGFVIGEGAAALVLERADHAAARGVRPLARLLGYGASTDAFHVVAPHPRGEGAQTAILCALTDAGVMPRQVDHVNAHGTSTPDNDRIEAAVLGRLFPHRPPVTSSKGVTGHSLGAAGAIEAALTVLAIRDGVIPPTAGTEHITPTIDADADIVTRTERPVPVRTALTNSFGFGGHNAVLVLAAP